MARIFQHNERPHTHFKNILKVNNINPWDYKEFTFRGFKKYNPGPSLEDQFEIQFKNYEPQVCSFFGCKKQLSLRQQMAGERCEDHPIGMRRFNNLPL